MSRPTKTAQRQSGITLIGLMFWAVLFCSVALVVVIKFSYDKEIELMDPVYLLIKFQGHSK